MEYVDLGPIKHVSRLSLGGGGIGQVWGETSRSEALQTVEQAVAAGINFFDLAPMYGNGEAESVVGTAFSDHYPEHIHVSTKCLLGDAPAEEIESQLRRSLDESCERLNRDNVSLYLLHGCVMEDDWIGAKHQKVLPRVAVPLSKYRSQVVPTFQRLKEEGRIQAWGITAASIPDIDVKILNSDERPEVVQCITNVLDSSGSMAIANHEANHRHTIKTATDRGCGVMGIRAVAAGSLTDKLDREIKANSPEQRDFERADMLRALASELGMSTAHLAHKYALHMDGVDTVVLGIKNREELGDCLAAESTPLEPGVLDRISQLYGNGAR